MNEISINLIDCISEITNRPICMDGENYLYLEDFMIVEDNVISEAEELKIGKEIEQSRVVMDSAIQNLLDTKAKEFILEASDNSRWKLTVSTTGVLTTTEVI